MAAAARAVFGVWREGESFVSGGGDGDFVIQPEGDGGGERGGEPAAADGGGAAAGEARQYPRPAGRWRKAGRDEAGL